MPDPGEFPHHTAAGSRFPAKSTAKEAGDPRVPLLNLSAVRSRMDFLHLFLSDSVSRNALLSKDHMAMVSSELSSAIQQIIVNGAALLACSSAAADLQPPPAAAAAEESQFQTPAAAEEEEEIDGGEIVEIDAAELLAEHIHFCEVCGKGFKRDANLRMHMRAHGNQFKTPEALAKPPAAAAAIGGGCDPTAAKAKGDSKAARFSCPFRGCNRNKSHRKFRPLKSVVCVRNHFKRSHCPKMYACDRCHKKSFSVLADLKSHLKHCGESKWLCSCGTSFSRKDKLFGHMALFEGHMPAVAAAAAVAAASGDEIRKIKAMGAGDDDDDDDDDEDLDSQGSKEAGTKSEVSAPPPAGAAAAAAEVAKCLDIEDFEGLLEEFGSIDSFNLQEMLNSPTGCNTGMDDIFSFL